MQDLIQFGLANIIGSRVKGGIYYTCMVVHKSENSIWDYIYTLPKDVRSVS